MYDIRLIHVSHHADGMGRFSSGSEAAAYIYDTVIPKVKACAKGLTGTSKRERLAAQIDCVMSAFGKK